MRKIALILGVFGFLSANSFFDGPFDRCYHTGDISLSEFSAFTNTYQHRPLKTNVGGMRSPGMFHLWFLTRKINPDLIIESGVWSGQSTWLLEQAAPKAKMISIDPVLKKRIFISKKARYQTKDFSTLDLSKFQGQTILAFFDDHQNAFERVKQAYAKGIKHLIFDDNYPNKNARHLTLDHCFNLKQHNDKKIELQKMIKTYFIMPQIIRSKKDQLNNGVSVTHIPALWGQIDEVPKTHQKHMSIFAKDAPYYRYTTYVELN